MWDDGTPVSTATTQVTNVELRTVLARRPAQAGGSSDWPPWRRQRAHHWASPGDPVHRVCSVSPSLTLRRLNTYVRP